MKYFLLSSLIFFPLFCLCQETSISGKVIDSVTNNPLSGATISLRDVSGNALHTGTTQMDGSFKIVLKSRTVASASFSYIQFAERILPVILQHEQRQIDLGTIRLQYYSDALESIVVRGQKPPVSMRFDKQIFKADAYANATGGNGVDLLRNLPSISVDAGGNISFRGSSSFLLLINGKVVQGDPATMLAQIPSANIESMEIITNPSAAYDAEGRSGIINVVTKNYQQEGWVFQANVMGGFPSLDGFGNDRIAKRWSADASIGYQKNKWDIQANVNYLRNDQAGLREGDVFTVINNRRTDFPSVGERSFKRYNYGARLSAGFQANAKNKWTAGFYTGEKFQVRDANLEYEIQRGGIMGGNPSTFLYYNANSQQKQGQFTLANLEWRHTFNPQSELVITGLYERANLTGLTTNLNVPAKNSSDTLQYTENPSKNPLNAYRIKMDYKNAGWSAGYQFRVDVQDGDFLYLTSITGTGSFITDPEFTSKVKAENLIHAGYVQYDGKKDSWQYSTGLRMETTNRELIFSKQSEKRTLSLVNFFPNARVQYQLPAKWTLKGGFSRRIRRTNNYELNPFPEREHSETLEQGDPELLPELIFLFETGLDHVYPSGSFFVTPYFQHIANPIQRTNSVYNDTILNRVFTNGDRALQWGIEMGNTQKINSWWQSIVGFNLYYYQIEGNLLNNTLSVKNQALAFTLNINQHFNLGKNWSSQMVINYLSNRPTLQGKDSYFLNPALSLKKQTDDQRWAFQLICQSLDLGWNSSNRQRITTSGQDFFTTTNYIYEVNQIQFSVGLNIMKKNRKIKVPESEMGEKEF